MEANLFDLLMGAPHLLLAIINYLSLTELLALSAAYPKLGKFLSDNFGRFQTQATHRLLRYSPPKGPQPLETTQAMTILVQRQHKFSMAATILQTQPIDPWFYDPLEVAVVLCQDFYEAQRFCRFLEQLHIQVHLLHGPLARPTREHLSKKKGLLVLVTYRLLGWFKFPYLRTFLTLHPPQSTTGFEDQLRRGALSNVALVHDANSEAKKGFRHLAYLNLKAYDPSVYPNRRETVPARGF